MPPPSSPSPRPGPSVVWAQVPFLLKCVEEHGGDAWKQLGPRGGQGWGWWIEPLPGRLTLSRAGWYSVTWAACSTVALWPQRMPIENSTLRRRLLAILKTFSRRGQNSFFQFSQNEMIFFAHLHENKRDGQSLQGEHEYLYGLSYISPPCLWCYTFWILISKTMWTGTLT